MFRLIPVTRPCFSWGSHIATCRCLTQLHTDRLTSWTWHWWIHFTEHLVDLEGEWQGMNEVQEFLRT